MHPEYRVIFDTNIYGELVEKDRDYLIKKISESTTVIVYGFEIIRKELRAAPSNTREYLHLRQDLLRTYNKIVSHHSFRVNTAIAALATEYALNYKGGISKHRMVSDFLIVACASIHRLDVIVTEDNHSMNSFLARQTYHKVNIKNGLKDPAFYSLMEFEKRSLFPV